MPSLERHHFISREAGAQKTPSEPKHMPRFVDKGFIKNTPNTSDNPILMVANRLIKKGHSIAIPDKAYDHQGDLVEDNVAIFIADLMENSESVDISSSNLRRMFWNITHDSPEIRSLSVAFKAEEGEPNVDDCDWSDKTKRKVKAMYWENRARKMEQLDDKESHEAEIAKAREKSKELLPKGSHLPTDRELKKLVNKTVDRELKIITRGDKRSKK